MALLDWTGVLSAAQAKKRWRRALANVGIGLGGLIVLLVVALMLPFVRGALLDVGVSVADGALPGRLVVDGARWPRLGTIEIGRVVWTREGQQLLLADHFAVSADLAALLRSDVVVEHLTLDNVHVDVPAIVSSFAPGDDGQQGEAAADGAFPRAGSLPGVPSIAVRALDVRASAVELSDSLSVVDAVINGSMTVLFDENAGLTITQLEAFDRAGQWAVEHLAIDVDFENGTFAGEGDGYLARRMPFALALDSAVRDSFALHVAIGADSLERVDLTARGKLDRDGLRVNGLTANTELQVPGTRALATSPVVGEFVRDLPDLERVAVATRTEMTFEPFTVLADITAAPNSWLKELKCRARVEDGGAGFDDYVLRLPGLALSGRIRKDPDAVDLQTSIHVEDTRWVETLAPGTDLPAASGKLDVRASGPLDAVDVELRANADVEGFVIDHVAVDATAARLDALESSLRVLVTTQGLDISFDGEVSAGDGIDARLSPIVIREAGTDATVDEVPGVVRLDEHRNLWVENLRLAGTVGDIVVSASLDSLLSGEAATVVRWYQPPTVLLRLAGIEVDSLPGFADAWGRDVPYEVAASAQLDGINKLVEVESGFVLPGPRDLSQLLPDSARVDDLGPLRGDANVTIDYSDEETRFRARLDLAETAWIDSSRVNVWHASGTTWFNRIHLAALGLTLDAHGPVGADSDLTAALSLANSEGVARFVPGVPAMTMSTNATVTGELADPNINATFAATLEDDQVRVPQLEGTLDYDGGLSTQFNAPQGVSVRDMTFETVALDVASLNDSGLLPARMQLDVAGEDFEWFHRLDVDTVGGLRVDVDTLATQIAGSDLRSQARFVVGMDDATEGVYARGVEMEGSLGSVRADGFASADSATVSADVELALPPAPAALGVPEGFWPSDLRLQIEALNPRDLTAALELEGFVVGDGQRPQLAVDVAARGDSLFASVVMSDSSGNYVDATMSVPAVISAYPPRADYLPGDVRLDLALNRFPLAMFALDAIERGTEVPAGEVARISGGLRLRGPTDRPVGDADIEVTFPDWPKLAAYKLNANASLGEGERGPGAEAAFLLTRGGDRVVRGGAYYPVELSLLPRAFAMGDGEVWYEIVADSLSLAEFDPLLPVDVSLGGALTLNLVGSGEVGNENLDGRLTMEQLMVATAQRARVTANSQIDISGPARAPKVSGEIEITRGVIQIPDLPPNLHPIEGESILLGDSIALEEDRDDDNRRSRPEEPHGNPQFDVTVKIPGNFWIRGKGLDLELAGELHLLHKGEKPSVEGELRAERATLDLLGRRLTLEEGSVKFLGGDEIDPALSITLSTRIEDTQVRILFGGTAQEPAVFFSSVPEMDEGDIMAVLLFGRPLDQLDDDQNNHMQQRTTEVVMALGAAQLQKEMSQQFGVDVFTYSAGENEEALGSFAFGKYLHPQVLLSYVRSLDDADDSFVSLEYFLSGRFKVRSVYGRRQSGLGIGWAKDY